ncbi:MAG: TIM barrel protein [Desulfobulbaceae bacterium]|nr:TIM barrel protein [Desulfobulbaceae bacterium]HIJ77715.1 sugar phosphate isomerase/epimerase [Deltaproteobacteria bacterium]
MAALKGRFPWRLGATSFVIPADISTNVRQLGGLVDDVQLLFFESAHNSTMAHEVDVAGLAELAVAQELSYTVHLPTDIRLGADSAALRQEGRDEILRLIDELRPLAPGCFDLHLCPEPDLAEADWLAHLDHSLGILAERLGGEKKLVAVENIDYPYPLVAELVAGHGFSSCLDLGHAARYGHDQAAALARLADNVCHLHYHGLQGGRDHRALTDGAAAGVLAENLMASGYEGVVTLELYSLDQLNISMALLAEAWQPYRK